MTSPLKAWEATTLQNSGNILRSSNPAIPQISSAQRNIPALPPRLQQSSYGANSYSNSYLPYSGLGGVGYGSYGSMPYRSSMYTTPYSSYGGYNTYSGYGTYGNYGARDIAEERFVQFAEERSRNTFANVENVVRAFSSISMMLDNTFFAMTSSFRAVLSVAENFGRLRTVFGQIWYSVNIFRLFTWLYRKLRSMMGFKAVQSSKSLAWNEAATGLAAEAGGSGGSNWPTLAFLGVILSAPYLISKLLPKYQDNCDPEKWKSSAIRAKAAFDFIATAPNELTVNTNDEILLAPRHIQDEMKLANTGWGYATCNGKSGVVPLNYLLVMKRVNSSNVSNQSTSSNGVPIPRPSTSRGNGKRVSFGETQFFESAEPFVTSDHKQNLQTATDASGNSKDIVECNAELDQNESKNNVATDDAVKGDCNVNRLET